MIETKRQSVDDCYLQEIFLNGQKQETVQLPFKEVVKGGKLILGLGSIPNEVLNH